jgi:hypothetical protein
VRHVNDAALNQAVRNAGTRPVGDAWAWARRGSGGDISPLVAATLALWGWSTRHNTIRAIDLNVW